MRLLSILVAVTIVVSSSSSAYGAEPEKDGDASPTIWPAHAAGAVGILGLGTALVFGSLQMNADHSARVAGATLARAGASPGACGAEPLRGDIAQMCWLLDRHENAGAFHQDAFTVALGVGLTSLAFAITWYLIAK